jgi:hypothetical protein
VVLVDVVVVTPLALRLVRTVVDPAGDLVVTEVLVAPVLLCEVRTVLELFGFACAAAIRSTSLQFRFTPQVRGTIGSFSPR